MITEYLSHQLERATYKILDDGTYFGEIPGLRGVWANAKTLEECRSELQGVLESWVVLKLHDGESLPGFRIPKKNQHILQYA